MIKTVGYWIFALFYNVSRLFPVNPKKVFLVATHDNSPEGNVGIVADALKKKDESMKLVWFTRDNKVTRPFDFFVVKAFHLATSSYVFLDNEFLPMAYFHFRKQVKVVQLWHGTGTIKKFGQDVNEGKLKKLEFKANTNITHLIVNSEAVKKEYASAFGIPLEKIFVLGLPRTDLLLEKNYLEDKKKELLDEYPRLRGKKCILYAPTFRDDEVELPQIHLDLDEMSMRLREDEVLLIRLHPHVAKQVSKVFDAGKWNNIINMSEYSGVTTLLAASDVLITDYSSIVFEYCLRKKPMLFYAYDLEQFEHDGRSFYRSYSDFVPGRIVKNQKELCDALESEEFDENDAFIRDNFTFLDGRSTARLFELIF